VGLSKNVHEEYALGFDGPVTATATSTTFKWGVGLGASAGASYSECAACSIEDVASGDSFSAEIDVILISGDFSGVEDANDNQPRVEGTKHKEIGFGAGPGAGFFVGPEIVGRQPFCPAPTTKMAGSGRCDWSG
jgi:hypothetical protein